MPIEIKCPKCAAAFRAPDKFAGKRVKCPKCQGTIAIPAAAKKDAASQKATEARSTAQPSKQQKAPEKSKQPSKTAAAKNPAKQATDQWFVQTDDGEQYGPVPKDELHDWIAEGRLDVSCQVLCEGWEQWKWAEEVFDELGKANKPAVEENPFAGIGDVTPPVETTNPFESPQTISSPAVTESEPSDGSVTPLMRQALAQTRPWVLFFSILGFLCGGLLVLGCLGLFVVSIMGGSFIFGFAMALVYGAMAVFYVYAAYFLLTYASQISKFLRSNQTRDLEQAIVAQKSFWKLSGIVTAVGMVLYFLLIIVMFAGGFMAASSSF